MKNKILLVSAIAVAGFLAANFAFAQTCPENTVPSGTGAILVGEVTNDGGDPNLTVWFQYGRSISYGSKTENQLRYGTGNFCATIYDLTPCVTYYYRAVAQNSAGISYGANETFKTSCLPAVDIRANGSNGPITLYYNDYVALSWTSGDSSYCEASGDWSGSKAVSGTQSIQLNQVKTYRFTITCTNSVTGQTASDSVDVVVKARTPVVITKPAIVTL